MKYATTFLAREGSRLRALSYYCIETCCQRCLLFARYVEGEFSDCSATCEGVQTRTVSCQQQQGDGNIRTVADRICDRDDPRIKPMTTQPCGVECSTYYWVTTEWSPCSVQCGGGIQQRNVYCSKEVADTVRSATDNECRSQVGLKPAIQRSCDPKPRCEYSLTEWTPCSASCDIGMRTRVATCSKIETDGTTELIVKRHCERDPSLTEPLVSEMCFAGECPCSLPRWVPGRWSLCTRTCGGGGRQQRDLQCQCNLRGESIFVNEQACASIDRPLSSRECGQEECPCERYRWRRGHWNECSADCGEGIQQRIVLCTCTQEGEIKISSNLAPCNIVPMPPVERECYGPPCPCENPNWQVSSWTNCSRSCNGRRSRTVRCICGGVPVTDAICLIRLPNETRPVDVELCGGPCQCENYRYRTSEWSHCSSSCGVGVQSRIVTCWCDLVGKQKFRKLNECETELGVAPPNVAQPCQSPCPCVNARYETEQWSPCSQPCGGARVRTVECYCSRDGVDGVVRDDNCSSLARPPPVEDCSPCEFKWTAAKWRRASLWRDQ